MDLNALTKLADVRRQRIDNLRTNPTPGSPLASVPT